MSLDGFIPSKDNFLYLKDNTYHCLLDSFELLIESVSINSTCQLQLKEIHSCATTCKEIMFPFMLLNYYLVTLYELEDFNELIGAVDDFHKHLNKLNNINKFIGYKDDILPEKYWTICEKVIKGSFAEPVYLAPPEKLKKDHMEEKINVALQEIKKANLFVYQEISEFISSFLIVKSNRFKAGSSFPMMGLIGLSQELDLKTIMDYIVHECAHQYIYHLTVFDELCSGSGDYSSPLRKDKRPLEGIYHATFVLARLIYFYSSFKVESSIINKAEIKDLLSNYLMKFYDGYTVLLQNATLTPLGESLLKSCKNYADQLS